MTFIYLAHGPGLIVQDTHQSNLVKSQMAKIAKEKAEKEKAEAAAAAASTSSSSSTTTNGVNGQKAISTASLQFTSTYRATAADVYSFWTDLSKIKMWTRDGRAHFTLKQGGDFKLLMGNVTGQLTNFVSKLCFFFFFSK